MSGEPIDETDLFVLFEAARWAPSAGNTHPWRILYARRDTEHWPLFFDLLVERNKVWCVRAAALLLFISRTTNEQTGKPLVTHTYDTGAAWENLALQGTLRGLVVHGMAGFDYAKAHAVLGIPYAEMTFLEDKVNHLDAAARLGVRCALAAWGYNGERELRQARARGYLVCTLDDLERQVFGEAARG